MTINFIKWRKVYYIFSLTLVLGSLLALIFFGLKLGNDFTGGSIMELEFKDKPVVSDVQEKLKAFNLGEITIQTIGEKGLTLRMKAIDENTHQEILKNLGEGITEKKFESIGPTVGNELKQKTKTFTILVLLAIIIYVAFAFKKASKPIASWQYGLIAALAAFLHDVLIPLGIFAV